MNPDSLREPMVAESLERGMLGGMYQGSTSPEQDLAEFWHLANKLGMTCRPESEFLTELGMTIAARMTPRVGDDVYQMQAAILHCFPKALLEKVLPASCITFSDDTTTTWTLTTVAQLNGSIPSILGLSGYACAGLTKAFQTKSEPVIRVVATLMPTFQVSHVTLASGVDRTYLNFAYVLATEHGELHWPKSKGTRLEILIPPELEEEMRVCVASDMLAMAQRGDRLSPGWWRQLGDEAKAAEVEYALANPPPPPPRAQRAPRIRSVDAVPKKAARKKQRRSTTESYDIDEIIAEKKVSSKEKMIYLVRWMGYKPEWEGARVSGPVGGLLETWEPLYLLKATEALERWKAHQSPRRVT